MLDKAFLEEAEKQALDIRPMKGDVLEKIVQEAVKTPPDILEKVRKIIDASGRDIRLEIDGGIKVDNITPDY